MKISLIGATGYVGSFILTEALNRGHEVIAIVRHPEKLPSHPNLTIKKGNILNENEFIKLIAGCDAVISAFNPWNKDTNQTQVSGTQSIITSVKKAGIKRLLVVGGAGSLEVRPGKIGRAHV